MRVVIFANGDLGDPVSTARLWIRDEDCIVAADGGTHHVLRAGLHPHHVIGDLDSLSPTLRTELERAGTQFHISPPQKDETDLELALKWAASLDGVQEILVLGALGGRPDQALANLLLLALPELAPYRVRVIDGAWTIQTIRAGARCEIAGTPGDRVSLIPLGGPAEGVTTTGLAYPLHNEPLHFGPARGVSNTLIDPRATVSVARGMVWCFHERQDMADALSAAKGPSEGPHQI